MIDYILFSKVEEVIESSEIDFELIGSVMCSFCFYSSIDYVINNTRLRTSQFITQAQSSPMYILPIMVFGRATNQYMISSFNEFVASENIVTNSIANRFDYYHMFFGLIVSIFSANLAIMYVWSEERFIMMREKYIHWYLYKSLKCSFFEKIHEPVIDIIGDLTLKTDIIFFSWFEGLGEFLMNLTAASIVFNFTEINNLYWNLNSLNIESKSSPNGSLTPAVSRNIVSQHSLPDVKRLSSDCLLNKCRSEIKSNVGITIVDQILKRLTDDEKLIESFEKLFKVDNKRFYAAVSLFACSHNEKFVEFTIDRALLSMKNVLDLCNIKAIHLSEEKLHTATMLANNMDINNASLQPRIADLESKISNTLGVVDSKCLKKIF